MNVNVIWGEYGDLLDSVAFADGIDRCKEAAKAAEIEWQVSKLQETLKQISEVEEMDASENRDDIEGLLGQSGESAADRSDLGFPGGDWEEGVDAAPAIELLNRILDEAQRQNASHIYLQPTQDRLVVRYRIDGVLCEAMVVPRKLQPVIAGRIKVMADLDSMERRLPQDGFFSRTGDSEKVCFRVSTAPTLEGERITIRIGQPQVMLRSIGGLGVSRSVEQLLRRAMECHQGLFIVTGPTGSGKTTTLYSLLAEMNSPEKNLLTVEAPIELTLPGISQMEAAPSIGNYVPALLRAATRQDADVIMCSKLDEYESAEEIVQMALTGRLMLCGMHTNDSAGAVLRLIEMGLQPDLVASCLIGILGQRLARRICDHCRQPYEPGDEELQSLALSGTQLQGGVLWRGRGCKECRNTGYAGRILIHETLEVDDAIRETIRRHPTADALKGDALKRGSSNFRADGAAKVLQGLTTIEEVLRITPR